MDWGSGKGMMSHLRQACIMFSIVYKYHPSSWKMTRQTWLDTIFTATPIAHVIIFQVQITNTDTYGQGAKHYI